MSNSLITEPRTSAAMPLELTEASAADAVLLGNLVELYIHDLSPMFPHVRLGADGRFGYPDLASYLCGSGSRRAFFIRHADGVAGFVLARRGSPVSDNPNVLDVAEFFVLRQFRGRGVGHAAAALLWRRMPGEWTVRAATTNANAVTFWRRAVAEYTKQSALEREHWNGNTKWIVFSFDSSLESLGT